jgi:radical SAM protein with 4Fe4S-binding SPASM domain
MFRRVPITAGEFGSDWLARVLSQLAPDLLKRTISECLPGRPFFEFFGGEPLLYRGIWDLITQIRQGGCNLAFPTNGTLVFDFADRLVATQPNLVWVSVDGPRDINDYQRGRGVFDKAIKGIEKVNELRRAQGSELPQIGIAYVVTPHNFKNIQDFFLRNLDLSLISYISIELQSYATESEHNQYSSLLQRFGISSAPYAKAFVRDPAIFAEMDPEVIASQMNAVALECTKRGIQFYSQPRTRETSNISNYLTAQWDRMIDRRSRCGIPWAYAEISARGDVTTCHSFYDLTIGNIHENSLLEIWRNERARQIRDFLREGLFPICTACCKYHSGAAPIAPSSSAQRHPHR